MRLAVYSSGPEAFPLFHVLKNNPVDVFLVIDRNVWPIDDKWSDLRQHSLDQFFATAKENACDAVILPPMVELALSQNDTSTPLPVVPLYSEYVRKVVEHSLVGKIGLLTESIDHDHAQELISTLLAEHPHKLGKTWSFRKKSVPLRKTFLLHLSVKDWMVRKVIKTDLRYFKDAGVDTLLPTSRAHCAFQSLIKHMVSWKRMRFHGYECLEDAFITSIESIAQTSTPEQSAYTIEIATNGDASLLLEQKKWQTLLGYQSE